MTTAAPPRSMLDHLLNLVAVKLELTVTQYEDAIQKYRAVDDWLSAPGSILYPYAPQLYPQGSLRILTTVKPRGHEEYDLDIVSQLAVNPRQVTWQQVYRWEKQRLREHGYYKTILELKNRCLRLNYAGQFHMDILPACPDPVLGGTAILVPDHKAGGWKSSDPKGYATSFEARSNWRLAEKAAQPVPPQVAPEFKAPLVRAVQLIKRQRDQVFTDADLAPASIVQTTLAAEAYAGQATTAEAVTRYLYYVSQLLDANPKMPFRVLNPVNKGEVLSERWESTPGAYEAFRRELYAFKDLWERLLRAQGTVEIHELLKQLFGEIVATDAVREYSARMGAAKEAGQFGTRPGSSSLYYGLGAGAAPGVVRVPRNTNYGISGSV
ncbi:MAG: nucleotidyltransferase [Dehalococcoidia bacterium]|nr:nucleotidyltransferase [Dehalococcoidia bacterium]